MKAPRVFFLLLLSFLCLNSVLLLLFDRLVQEPYMDEEFHIPQAQRYCRRLPPAFYHPSISTPPGLYWVSSLVLRALSTPASLASLALLRRASAEEEIMRVRQEGARDEAGGGCRDVEDSALGWHSELAERRGKPETNAGAGMQNLAGDASKRTEEGGELRQSTLPFFCRYVSSFRAFNALIVSPLTLVLLWHLAKALRRPWAGSASLASAHAAWEARSFARSSDAAFAFLSTIVAPAGGDAEASDLLVALRVARAALLPTFYFYNFLFYTDPLGALLLLFAYAQLLLSPSLWSFAAAATLAFFVRQTSVVWSGGACLLTFLAATSVLSTGESRVQETLPARQAKSRVSSDRAATPAKRQPPRGAHAGEAEKEGTRHTEETQRSVWARLLPSGFQTSGAAGAHLARSTWESAKSALAFFFSPRACCRVTLPLAAPLLAFALFVVFNGGKVAVGHQAFHRPRVHTAQLLYAALAVASAASPATYLVVLRRLSCLLKALFAVVDAWARQSLGKELHGFCGLKSEALEGEGQTAGERRAETHAPTEARRDAKRMKAPLSGAGSALEETSESQRTSSSSDCSRGGDGCVETDQGDMPRHCGAFFMYFVCLSLAAGIGAIAHPFILNDSRHVVFYLWRHVLRFPLFRWLVGPFAAACYLAFGMPCSLVSPPVPACIVSRSKCSGQLGAEHEAAAEAKAGGERVKGEGTDAKSRRQQEEGREWEADPAASPEFAKRIPADIPAASDLRFVCPRSSRFYTFASLFTFFLCCVLALVPTGLIEPRYFLFLLLLFVLHERFPSSREANLASSRRRRSPGKPEEAQLAESSSAEDMACTYSRYSRSVAGASAAARLATRRRENGEGAAESVADNVNEGEADALQDSKVLRTQSAKNGERENVLWLLLRCLLNPSCWRNLYRGRDLGEKEDLANEAAALLINASLSCVIFFVFLYRPYRDAAGNIARFML
ncbi:hypothetical protein BESB_000440 [Besnoitia besnoiti]|uniref:Dol-P-Glc:Glc(2)Man(9)GlcNAc(2)-PP-Dol alpha-1,2-glucosyltransferase n=1 Tax=Besnoitia besnoiti TaxID=94643 RepID=A0A2A9MPH3_BESBE|nr:hypothetical protein BESB_000440 [Besnoitia besnoiti]PFH37702.1 hypothetical protein BESB_000440 [Besnoitia besnoiti]